VSVEWFMKLKEISSLTKMRINHLKNLNEQENRLSNLYGKRQEKNMQTVKLQQEQNAIQQTIFELEKDLKNADLQRQRLIDIGGDQNKISAYQKEVLQYEEKGFLLFEELEKNQSDLEDAKTFLSGIEKTIAEIKSEVEEEVLKEKKAIIQTELRLKLLDDELPADFRHLLHHTSAKNLAHGPFTRIENGSCFFCRFKISRTDESEIDMQQKLKTCPQCDRIFLPYGA
jgi:predicted  nucleic acid-binding Zn-ribbon protein